MVNRTGTQTSWANNLGWRHGRNGMVRTQKSYDRLREHMRHADQEEMKKKIVEERQKARMWGQRYLSPYQRKCGARLIA